MQRLLYKYRRSCRVLGKGVREGGKREGNRLSIQQTTSALGVGNPIRENLDKLSAKYVDGHISIAHQAIHKGSSMLLKRQSYLGVRTYVCAVGVLTYETQEAYCGTDDAGQGVGKLAEELSFKHRVFRSRLRQETTDHRSLGKDQTVE